ncbi:hypothetical protein DERP_008135 [Dermatophagoides pteronyssinus]|uniref:Uncharacterized protein n=1 Tax=Dermatophagoides pteronyssinus TaxID=6956 RepID=A0ABQ8JJU4_DERPT|nr:hypothetical protein DERP_008135 [Dermatophagoides pteronyssinus]
MPGSEANFAGTTKKKIMAHIIHGHIKSTLRNRCQLKQKEKKIELNRFRLTYIKTTAYNDNDLLMKLN